MLYSVVICPRAKDISDNKLQLFKYSPGINLLITFLFFIFLPKFLFDLLIHLYQGT